MVTSMRVAIASGKGGTGKTLVAVSLALVAARRDDLGVHLIDGDVEAPDAALFLRPDLIERRETGILVPEIDAARCTVCGTCTAVCAFHAMATAGDRVLVFPDLCHGCGSCRRQCPESAIHERLFRTGVLEAGRAGRIVFSHGRLDIGRAMATPVLRELGRWRPGTLGEVALAAPSLLTLVDAPPGSGCPAREAVSGSDLALLVTEPTPFGLHDLELAVRLVRDALGVPVGVVVNRDTGDGRAVERFCAREHLPVVMRLPFERRIAAALASGQPLVRALPDLAGRFEQLLDWVLERTGGLRCTSSSF
jgi:MinD superfamily P-loop ATPase